MLSLLLCLWHTVWAGMSTHRRPALRLAIGQRLRQLRAETGGLSQETLANWAGVHRTYVGRLERGESGVTVDMLAAVVAPMKVSLAQFFKPFDKLMVPTTPRRRE